MNKFPVRVKGNDQIISKIFPSKQQSVVDIITIAEQTEAIKKIVVFGSALTYNCGLFSDLDIAIMHTLPEDEFEKICSKFRDVGSKLDIVDYSHIHNNNLKINVEKGVVIFERLD